MCSVNMYTHVRTYKQLHTRLYAQLHTYIKEQTGIQTYVIYVHAHMRTTAVVNARMNNVPIWGGQQDRTTTYCMFLHESRAPEPSASDLSNEAAALSGLRSR